MSRHLMHFGLVPILSLALTIAASVSAFAVPHDAGWKARGMRDDSVRSYSRSYAAPAMGAPAGRQAFSYEPGVTQSAPARCEYVPAPATADTARRAQGTRAFSYEPAAPERTYQAPRGIRRPSGYGGDYPSKATLRY